MVVAVDPGVIVERPGSTTWPEPFCDDTSMRTFSGMSLCVWRSVRHATLRWFACRSYVTYSGNGCLAALVIPMTAPYSVYISVSPCAYVCMFDDRCHCTRFPHMCIWQCYVCALHVGICQPLRLVRINGLCARFITLRSIHNDYWMNNVVEVLKDSSTLWYWIFRLLTHISMFACNLITYLSLPLAVVP